MSYGELISPAGEPISVQPPQGPARKLDSGEAKANSGEQRASAQVNFADTDAPGIYKVSVGSESWQLAVNLPPDESKTAPIAVEELQRLGLPLKVPVADLARQIEQKKKLQNLELEARQKLWRWLILGALVVLMLETWVAGFIGRRASQQPAASV